MCSSKPNISSAAVARINGRPVLQPKSNQIPTLERPNSLKNNSLKSPTAASPNKTKQASSSPPLSPKRNSPALKRAHDLNVLNSSTESVSRPRKTSKVLSSNVKKSKKSIPESTSLLVQSPGSLAASRREQLASMQKQRKLKTAHYGRLKPGSNHSNNNNSNKCDGSSVAPVNSPVNISVHRDERRCNFISPSSDPIYIAYHDEEWGVPVHDDKMLFELLVLTGAQVGSDWTTVLKKRAAFREAFSGFEAENVAKFTEKKITSISTERGIDLTLVRRIVDNSNRILQVKKEFGSFDKYLWGFVNYKPMIWEYKTSKKIPIRTSKSETISKDMVKRGFRYVGPSAISSFMQAAGLTNGHIISCSRHQHCLALASQS